jgi:MFS family permease
VPVALFLIKDSPQSVGLMPYGYEEKKSDGSETASKSIPGVPYGSAVKSLPFILLSVSFLIIAYVAGVLQHLPVFISGEGGKGLTGAQAGSIMSIFMLAMIAAKILMGIMNDKLGLKVTTALVLGLFAGSCAIMPFLSGFVPLVCVMIIMSFGFGSVSVLAPLITGVIFGQKDFSGIWGILGMSGALGTAVGAPLWGAFYDATGSYNSGFFVAVALLIIATVLIFLSINSAKSAGWQ